MRAHLKQVQDANNGSLSRYKAREAEEERDTIELSSAQLSPGQARLGQSASRHSHRLHEMPVSQGSRERGRWRSERGKRVPNSKGASDRSFDGSCCLLITRFLGNAMRCTANGEGEGRREEGGGMASRSDWDPVASCHNGADASGCNMRLSCDRRQNITSITAHRAQTTMLPQVRQRESERERESKREECSLRL